MRSEQSSLLDSRDRASVQELVSAALGSTTFELNPIKGGGNNQVFRISIGSENYLLKKYFRDSRERLKHEFLFSSYAWEHGVRAIPKPIAKDDGVNIALYEFVTGERFLPGKVWEAEVKAALSFVNSLNISRKDAIAKTLPTASEACFSIAAHLDLISERIERLGKIKSDNPLDNEALNFVQDSLNPTYDKIAKEITTRFNSALSDTLPTTGRCISPSDFGFHNALRRPNGEIVFVDFEYAGWDDPAKLTCDFFCQQAVPVPMSFFKLFQNEISAIMSDDENYSARAELLMPLCKLKWCCIVLNEFLPRDRERREFARPHQKIEEQKHIQLGRARALLQSLSKR